MRHMSSQGSLDIGKLFIKDEVQNILKAMTRFTEDKIFAQRPVPRLYSPQLMFMTDDQLKRAKDLAYETAKARIQMPPVMEADNSEPAVLARNPEVEGYTRFKVMFVDIGPGYTNRNRLMSVRETDGTLRYPSHDERSRLNHMFFPDDSKSLDCPKLFEKENLMRLLKRREYVYVLNRACAQFEPDDPRYVSCTREVYNYVNDQADFDKLRSTRHFGPMVLYLVYSKNTDILRKEMQSKKLDEDIVNLDKLIEICHGPQEETTPPTTTTEGSEDH